MPGEHLHTVLATELPFVIWLLSLVISAKYISLRFEKALLIAFPLMLPEYSSL